MKRGQGVLVLLVVGFLVVKNPGMAADFVLAVTSSLGTFIADVFRGAWS